MDTKVFAIEGASIRLELDEIVTTTKQAVDVALYTSERFIRESLVRISGTDTTQVERETTSCERGVTATKVKAVFHNNVQKKFQPLEAACFEGAKEVWGFFTRHKSVGLRSDEILELKERRTALKDQLAYMEDSWGKLVPGSDFNTIFVKLTELVRTIVATVDKALLDKEQPPLVGDTADENAEQDVPEGDIHRSGIGQDAGGDLVEDTGSQRGGALEDPYSQGVN